MFKKTILFSTILSLIFLSACSLKKEDVISIDEAKIKAEEFINENFVDPAYPVSIVSIIEDEQTGLYKTSVDLGNGQIIEAYISKDGKMFFPQAYEIAEIEQALKAEPNVEVNDESIDVDNNETLSSENNDAVSSEVLVSEDYFNEAANFESDKKLAIYFFWGEGCGHCAGQKTAMKAWAEKYPDIEIKTYETWNNNDNRVIFENLASAYETSVQGVPMTFIGDKTWIGYADSYGVEMQAKIEDCLNKGNCENPGKRLK